MSVRAESDAGGYCLRGALAEGGGRWLFDRCAELRLSGRLELAAGGRSATVTFVAGDPVAATGGDEAGLRAWSAGDFRLIQCVPDFNGALTAGIRLQGSLAAVPARDLIRHCEDTRLTADLAIERGNGARASIRFAHGRVAASDVAGDTALSVLAKLADWREGSWSIALRPLFAADAPAPPPLKPQRPPGPAPLFDVTKQVELPEASGRIAPPPVVRQEPSGRAAPPPMAKTEPSERRSAPPTAKTEPNARFPPPAAAKTEPNARFPPPAAAKTEPSGRFSAPPTAKTEPSGRFSAPPTAKTEPSGRFSAPPTAKTEPSGRFPSPTAATSEPSGRFAAPTASSVRPTEVIAALREPVVRQTVQMAPLPPPPPNLDTGATSTVQAAPASARWKIIALASAIFVLLIGAGLAARALRRTPAAPPTLPAPDAVGDEDPAPVPAPAGGSAARASECGAKAVLLIDGRGSVVVDGKRVKGPRSLRLGAGPHRVGDEEIVLAPGERRHVKAR